MLAAAAAAAASGPASVAVVGGGPDEGGEGGARSAAVVLHRLLPLDDVLRVLAVVDRTGHFLFLLVVHLCVDAAAAWKLPEKERGIGVLSPLPRTVGFVVWSVDCCTAAFIR